MLVSFSDGTKREVEITACANLYGADLRGADLHGANLHGADLHGADLYDADLHGANLRGVNLHGANLRGVNLHGADLHGADLHATKRLPQEVSDFTTVCPEGDVVAWKKLSNGVIAKLMVPALAKRSSATSRKCRAQFVHVIAMFSADGKELPHGAIVMSHRDLKTAYEVGKTVTCDKWDDDRWIECSGGIHFFITRGEAERY